MAVNAHLKERANSGWRLGLKNLYKKESNEWWRSRRWWVQLLIWTAIIDGLMTSTIYGLQQAALISDESFTRAELFETGLQTLFGVATLALALGIIILTQSEFIAEKQNGTAAWILSKPVSRKAFYLSKFLSTLLPMTLIMVGMPLLLGFLILTGLGFSLSMPQYLLAGALLWLHTLFYLTLSLMLGILFEKRAQLLAVSLGCLFGGQLLCGVIKQLALVGPFALSQVMPVITIQGPGVIPLNFWLAPAFTVLWIIAFFIFALYKIEKLEVD